jgi:hypothetical protein
MPTAGMLCRAALVRIYVWEECSASIIRNLCSVRQLPDTANVPSPAILVTLMMEALCSYEMSVLTRATGCNIPEDGILHSHHHENLKFQTLCYALNTLTRQELT